MTLRAVPAPTNLPSEDAYLDAVQQRALDLDHARDELWDGLAGRNPELVVAASLRLLAVALCLRDAYHSRQHGGAA